MEIEYCTFVDILLGFGVVDGVGDDFGGGWGRWGAYGCESFGGEVQYGHDGCGAEFSCLPLFVDFACSQVVSRSGLELSLMRI